MVRGPREGGRGGGMHCAILCVGEIQGGEIKEVFRANNRIDQRTLPELTNEYLAKVEFSRSPPQT